MNKNKHKIAIVGCGKMGLALGYFSLLLGFNNLVLHDIEPDNAHHLKNHLHNRYQTLDLFHNPHV